MSRQDGLLWTYPNTHALAVTMEHQIGNECDRRLPLPFYVYIDGV